MNLSEISMDKAAARQAFLDYRRAFAAEHDAIDGELMRGYKALAAGRQLIRLSETIRTGGVDDRGRPRLAIGRADEEAVTFFRDRAGAVQFAPTVGTDWANRPVRARDRRIRLGSGTLPDGEWIQEGTWEAIAPIIPPRLRPPHAIENYHLLWEPVWTVPTRRRSPVDPALLRHLGGDLWAVLATWDLTPLEQAVLEMRS